MKLTTHFTYEEMTFSEVAKRNGWDNTPNDAQLENLKRLCALLESVKGALGMRPIIVSSGYRSKQVNDAVGSKDTSQHRLGCAADFKVPGMTPREVVTACIKSAVPFDQIILEFDSWTHISVPSDLTLRPRNQALIIDRAGTRPFSA